MNFKPKLISHINRFKDNCIRNKLVKTLVYHWTGPKNLKGTLDWFDNMVWGRGSVGFLFIIDLKGNIHQLATFFDWFYNTQSSSAFDQNTIPIAFESKGDFPNKPQIQANNYLLNEIIKPFITIKEVCCHRQLNKKKPDFPAPYWKKLKSLMDV